MRPCVPVTHVWEVVGFEPGRLLSYQALSGVPLRNYRGEVVLREVAGGTRSPTPSPPTDGYHCSSRPS